MPFTSSSSYNDGYTQYFKVSLHKLDRYFTSPSDFTHTINIAICICVIHHVQLSFIIMVINKSIFVASVLIFLSKYHFCPPFNQVQLFFPFVVFLFLCQFQGFLLQKESIINHIVGQSGVTCLCWTLF